MEKVSLEKGVIISDSINCVGSQDYIEVKLQDEKIVIITASCNGRLKVGLKLDDRICRTCTF